VGRSAIAEAASAHSRINVPLNLENWASLDEQTQATLVWFHQHLLDEGLGWDAAAEALGFGSDDKDAASTLFAVLKGTYAGDWKAIVVRIEDYRKIAGERASLQVAEFSPNPVSETIWSGLDYALASSSIVIIEGDSGHGKSISGRAWLEKKAPGRGLMREAPSIGGTRVFIGEIVMGLGGNKNMAIGQMRHAVFRGFNRNRILMIDEATRLLPKDKRTMPEKLEFLREMHDRTGGALALFTTRRLSDEMEDSNYLFEQVLGRALVIRLPIKLEESAYRPIVVQYFPRPTARLLAACGQLANNAIPGQRGRLRVMAKTLQLASRIAAKEKEKNPRVRFNEEHFFKALAVRDQLMGRNQEVA
jgi:hypothetical protein